MNQEPREFTELDHLTEDKLGFAPLSEGLGLKQRAPAKPAPMGTGAMQAGPARVAPAIRTAAASPQAQAAPVISPMSEPGAHPALRSAAFTLDLLFVVGPLFIAAHALFGAGEMAALWANHRREILSFTGLYVLIYFLLAESMGGQSLGKMLFQLRIVEDDKYQKPIGFGTAFRRLILLPLTVIPAGLGLFAALWDVKHRAWHDKFTATIVRARK